MKNEVKFIMTGYLCFSLLFSMIFSLPVIITYCLYANMLTLGIISDLELISAMLPATVIMLLLVSCTLSSLVVCIYWAFEDFFNLIHKMKLDNKYNSGPKIEFLDIKAAIICFESLGSLFFA